MTSLRFPFQSIESVISMEKELSRNTEPDGALFSVTHRKPASDGEELYRNDKPAYHDLRDESEGQSDIARAVRWSDSLVE